MYYIMLSADCQGSQFFQKTAVLVVVVFECYLHGLFLLDWLVRSLFTLEDGSSLEALYIIISITLVAEPVIINISLAVSVIYMAGSVH